MSSNALIEPRDDHLDMSPVFHLVEWHAQDSDGRHGLRRDGDHFTGRFET